MNKTMLSILKTLENQADIVGSREIAKQLKLHGVHLTERTVRYHLKILDERGYTEVFGKEGRKITERGRKELTHALISERVGFVSSKIETLSFLTKLNLETMRGDIILNISFFAEKHLKNIVPILRTVFSSPFVMSDRMIFARSGDSIGDLTVPEGKVGIGTVCSVPINGVFLKAGIPDTSRFGGSTRDQQRRAVPLYRPHQLVRLKRVVVTEIIDNTYYAMLSITDGRKGTLIDSRPSDAVAIALRLSAPIYVEETILSTKTADELDEWLKNLRPEDFGNIM